VEVERMQKSMMMGALQRKGVSGRGGQNEKSQQ
jgi:hypothetical protein